MYIAVFIGGITATGSMVAFGKLSLSSKALNLPGRDALNIGMLVICAAGMAAFLNPALVSSIDPETLRLVSLGVVGVVSSLLGLHLTASIGGVDRYGWASFAQEEGLDGVKGGGEG